MQNFIENREFSNLDSGIDLSNKVIQESAFTSLNLSALNIQNATFNSCRFTSCDFKTQMIEGCTFYDCDFSECLFEGANLHCCSIFESSPSGLSIRRLPLRKSILSKCDLLELIGLCLRLKRLASLNALLTVRLLPRSIGLTFQFVKPISQKLNLAQRTSKEVSC